MLFHVISYSSFAKIAFALMHNVRSDSLCSRSDVSTCPDQCSSPQLTHSFLLCKYPAPPSTDSRLKTQSHTLTAQLLAAEDLTPLSTPMLIEEGYDTIKHQTPLGLHLTGSWPMSKSGQYIAYLKYICGDFC